MARQLLFCLCQHSYTVVENFSTVWVMETSETLLGRERPLPGKPLYIKIHGERDRELM